MLIRMASSLEPKQGNKYLQDNAHKTRKNWFVIRFAIVALNHGVCLLSDISVAHRFGFLSFSDLSRILQALVVQL